MDIDWYAVARALKSALRQYRAWRRTLGERVGCSNGDPIERRLGIRNSMRLPRIDQWPHSRMMRGKSQNCLAHQIERERGRRHELRALHAVAQVFTRCKTRSSL
jgi:hypothetical protein